MRFALVLIALVLAIGEQRARAASDPVSNGKEAAQAFARGKRLFAERDYVGAVEAFGQAYKLKPHFLVLCNIARCYERSGDMIRAADFYRQCLEKGGQASDQATRVQTALDHVAQRITWIQVNSPGVGGEIFVDGKPMGRAPQRVQLNPGTHVVEVRREGATPARLDITTRGGERQDVLLVPKAEPVKVGGDKLKEKDPVSVKKPVDKGLRVLSSTWFWISAALTAACAASAIGLGVSTTKLRDEYVANPTRAGYDSAVQRRTLTNVFWGLTAAAGASATVLFFFTDFGGPAERRDRASLGIGLRGTF
jgi:hypothetical protein